MDAVLAEAFENDDSRGDASARLAPAGPSRHEALGARLWVPGVTATYPATVSIFNLTPIFLMPCVSGVRQVRDKKPITCVQRN